MPVFIENSDGDVGHLDEKSTGAIVCVFTDEEGDSVTPDTIVWSLTDEDGTVINDLDQEEVSSPASTTTIALSGDDLAIQSGETARFVKRCVIIEATYDSDLGNDLPLKEEGVFHLNNLTKIA